MGSVPATIAAGWLLLAAGLAVLMSQSAIRQAGSNRVPLEAAIGKLAAGQRFCQRGEVVPAGTAALRAYAYPIARRSGTLTVTVRSDASGAIVARGVAVGEPGYEPILVPVRPAVRDETPATVCLASAGGSPLGLAGEPSGTGSTTVDGRPLRGALRIVYLQPHAESWWRFLPTFLSRMSAGERWSGAQAALLVLLLSLTAAGIASWQLARQRR